jgi:hypothetical protein
MAVRTAAGEQLFDCVQATWNLMEQSAGKGGIVFDNVGLSPLDGTLSTRVTGPDPARPAYGICRIAV